MIDNLKLIIPLLNFESEDDFYYLQILQRKKENPELGSNSRVIKNYYIKSIEELENKYMEIKALCYEFNARAMFRLNKRSFKKVAFKCMVNVANTMNNGEYKFVGKSYDRACGLGHNDKNKTWILDIDDWSEELDRAVQTYVNSRQPKGNKVVINLQSKNGAHLIVKPFNLENFQNIFPTIEIHKDNPTNLFIP